MPDHKFDDLIQKIVAAGLLGTMTAIIRLLMTKGESLNQKIRTFFAGVILAVVAGWMLSYSNMGEMWKSLIEGSCGAFVSTIWPIIEKGVSKFTQKKVDHVVRNTDLDKH